MQKSVATVQKSVTNENHRDDKINQSVNLKAVLFKRSTGHRLLQNKRLTSRGKYGFYLYF